MDKERMDVRDILPWVVLILLALVKALTGGSWWPFIVVSSPFVVIKALLFWQWWRLEKNTDDLFSELEKHGRHNYIPKPEEMRAMREKADAITEEINLHCPPQECLRFSVDEGRQPSPFDSKLGGTPYWDPSLPYPNDADGKPMAMVMQVCFDDCPHIEALPSEGMLQFFITTDEDRLTESYGMDFNDPTSQDYCRVVYHPSVNKDIDLDALRQYPRCEEFESSPVMGECALNMEKVESCINQSCNGFGKLFGQAVEYLYGDKVEKDEWPMDYFTRDLPEEHRHKVDDVVVVGDKMMFYGPTEQNFQMLGFPAFEQMEQRPVGCRQDTLLLQIPTVMKSDIENYHTLWGDCGSARLFINADDLSQQDFSQVYFDFQCY